MKLERLHGAGELLLKLVLQLVWLYWRAAQRTASSTSTPSPDLNRLFTGDLVFVNSLAGQALEFFFSHRGHDRILLSLGAPTLIGRLYLGHLNGNRS